MGSHVALVKGNRQMGFQVDRATHILYSLQENPQRSPARLKKKRIIELIITENHGCDPGTGRR